MGAALSMVIGVIIGVIFTIVLMSFIVIGSESEAKIKVLEQEKLINHKDGIIKMQKEEIKRLKKGVNYEI